MVLVSIEKTTYAADEEISIELDFTESSDLLDGASNININIFRVDEQRNNFAFGFGGSTETDHGVLRIKQKLPDNFTTGLYLVSGIKLLYGEEATDVKHIQIHNSNSLFFWCSDQEPILLQELQLKIQEMGRASYDFVNKKIITKSASNVNQATNYKVIIFSVGCLIHSSQIMEGYTLHPLGHGYSYDHMLDSVNNFTSRKYGFTLAKVAQIEMSFSSSTPLFAIEFNNVIAISHEDASIHCSELAENIFTVLAYDRGQRPNSFATVMINQSSNESWQSFHFPGYKGNLISDFNPSSIANTLERMLPKLENSSWIDLIMRIYADAKTETNPYYSCLKYWSILEMISKNHVQDNNIELIKPNGSPLLNNGGSVVTTRSALGKAYKYAFDKEFPSSYSQDTNGNKIIFESTSDATSNPNYDENTIIVTLWELLSSLYEVRNATAHTGQFNVEQAKLGSEREKKAAQLWELRHNSFLGHIQLTIKLVVSWEINNA